MINKIGVLGNVNVVARPTFKAEENKVVTQPKEVYKSADAISSYGVAAVNMAKKFDMTPLEATIIQPNYSHSIKGERIYTSEGRLYSIIDEDETTRTIYTPNKDDERFFDRIETIDKETGKLIRKQENYVEDGEYDEMRVYVYSKETGDLVAETTYNEGKLYSSTKYISNKNGMEESITYNYQDKDYAWYKDSEDGNRKTFMRITDDFKFVNYSDTKRTKSKEIEVEASFYNGGMISLTEEKSTIIPNLMGREPLNDADLKPAEKYNLEAIAPDFEGEKTYFSNGAVESITIPDGTAYFTPEGKVERLVSPTKEIEVTPDGSQIIKEKLDDNTTRTTAYHVSGEFLYVEYENDALYKELNMTPEGKLRYYCEESKDGEVDIALHYNKQGILESAYSF